MAKRKYRFKDHTEIKAEHCQHIIQYLRNGDTDSASNALHELALQVKDIKDFEVFHLAQHLKGESRKAA